MPDAAAPIPEKKEQPRDAKGHFMGRTMETDGPITIISKPPKDPLDEPLVSFSMQNPFKKLLHWLDDLRRHQTTSFSFKINIPLLALPIFLATLGTAFTLFFSLGKYFQKQETAALPTPTPIVIMQPTATPAPVLVSKNGTIKATYLTAPVDNTEGSSSATIEHTPTSTPAPLRYVLVKGLDITFLTVPSDINLSYYLNRKVLITGLYDKTTDTLKVSKSSDIEVLP